MTFNLLPPKWLNKKNGERVATRREQEHELDHEHPMYSLQNEMNRVFDDFFRSWDSPARSLDLASSSTFQKSALTPRIDVHETDKEVRISAELPGMSEQEIDVSLSKDMLTISGEKKQETEHNVQGWYRMERTYGAFTRSISLPCDVDRDSCKASFKNGVLTVSLVKTPESQALLKNIPIKKE